MTHRRQRYAGAESRQKCKSSPTESAKSKHTFDPVHTLRAVLDQLSPPRVCSCSGLDVRECENDANPTRAKFLILFLCFPVLSFEHHHHRSY